MVDYGFFEMSVHNDCQVGEQSHTPRDTMPGNSTTWHGIK
jgi:hypothetical protein